MRRAPAGSGCLAVLALLALALPGPASAERIRDFRVDVRVEEDGALRVEERIVYDFEGARRHGIYRDVPVRYERGPSAEWRIRLDVESVTDADGSERPFRVSSEGRLRRIRIGSPHREVTGVHEYRIAYRVQRAVLWLESHDELYWNATGSEWRVPIDTTSVRVRLPDPADGLPFLCFTGPLGSIETECSGETAPGEVAFQADRPLAAREGLTVVVSIPKGMLRAPGALARFFQRAGDFAGWPLVLPVLAFAGLGGLWWTTGRDPAGALAIPVRYEPPEDMSPAEVGAVLDERVDMVDVTATILDLAVRGYLQIEETESRKFLFLSETDYVFHRSTKQEDGLKPHEWRLLDGLFSGRSSVVLSSLKERFYTRLPGIEDALYREVSKDGRWFPTRPDRVRRRYAAIGTLVPGALAVFAYASQNLPLLLAMVACAGIGWFWSRHMPRRTRKGRRACQHILGFQEFVGRVERDRLERLGLRDVSNFERLLPYAFVLGVADAWAESFADLYTQPPDWYVGGADGSFRPRRFVSQVGRSLETAGSVMRSAPSRGSGSSGFSSGGGFSGGGFGGGGGGSW